MRRLVGCVLVVVLLVLLPGPISSRVCAQSPDDSLRPDWTWRLRPGIEWASLVGPADQRVVLVATRAAQLQLIDTRTGRELLTSPIDVAKGVRPTSVESDAAGDAAYCFDRHTAYAIHLPEPVGLKWRHGPLPADAAHFQGDPEVLTGWLAAAVADAGLLLVGRDGRVLLLSHPDGHLLWQLDLPRPTLVRLHVWNDHAALLWKTAAGTCIVFLRLSDTRPTPIVREAGPTWPLWSTLLKDSLLTAAVDGVTLWPREGEPRRLGVHSTAATTVDLGRTPSPLLLLAVDGGVSARSPGGNLVWRQSRTPGPGRECEQLSVRGTRVVIAGGGGVSVLDAATGRVLGEYRRPMAGMPIAAEPIGDCLYVLNNAARTGTGALTMTCVELRVPAASQPTTSIHRSREFRLLPERDVGERNQSMQDGGIRLVLWTDRSVILVEPDRLRAYTLPVNGQ